MINVIAFVANKNTLHRTHLIFLLVNNRLSYNSIARSFNMTNIFKAGLIISVCFIESKFTRSNRAAIAKIVGGQYKF